LLDLGGGIRRLLANLIRGFLVLGAGSEQRYRKENEGSANHLPKHDCVMLDGSRLLAVRLAPVIVLV
jgi:hypothetical protein